MASDSTLSRRLLLERSATVAGGLALAPLAARLAVPSAAAASPETADLVADAADWTNADYWAFADRILARFDDRWQNDVGGYSPVRNPYSTANNAALLTVHATAALHGHQGPARDDERARELVRRLTDEPAPWRRVGSRRRDDKMFHTPGWTSSLSNPEAKQDKAIDPKVAEGLGARPPGGRRHRSRAGRAGDDRRLRRPLRAGALLSLSKRAPQPDQLELRAVRAGVTAHR